MSRYQSSSVQLSPQRLAMTAAAQTYFAASAVTLCPSTELAALAAAVAEPNGDAVVLGEVTRLLGDTRLATLCDSAGGDLPARLATVTADLGSAGIGAAVSGLGCAEVSSLLDDLVPALAREERAVVAATAVDTLGDLGYAVTHSSGEYTDGVEARRGHEVLLLAVADGGDLHADHLHTYGECADRQARFEDGMAERGVTMARTAITSHLDDTGPLEVAAAAAGAPSLAHGIAVNGITSTRGRAGRNTARAPLARRQSVAGGSA